VYVDSQMVAGWEKRYGAPVVWRHHQSLTPADYDGIKASQREGRAHDVTLYIESKGRIAVIAKPIYPAGLFRTPSGGLHVGESLEEGALREAHEETGLHVRLGRYLLRAEVTFDDGARQIFWTTHVFTATTDDELVVPIDTKEIREARWALPEEFSVFDAMMRNASRGGLRYRAALHQHVARLLPLFSKSPQQQS